MTLLPPKGKRKSWYYDLTVHGQRVCKGGFKTKGEARTAREARRRELKTPTSAVTGYSFREVANEYLDWAQRKFIPKTNKYKISVYRQFIAFNGDIPITAITIPILEKYLATRQSNTNYNRHRRELCALLRWAWKRRYFPEDLCAFMESMPEERYVPRVYTQEEAVNILLASGELRVFFMALYSLAARVGEINRLRWEDVDFTNRQVILWTRKRTGIWRDQAKAMNEELYDELSRIYGKRSGEWVFPNPDTGLPYVDRRKQLQRICRQTGIPYLGFHAIRHSVASLLADIYKISLPTLQKLLGHSRMTTTQKYIHSLGHGEREAAAFLRIPENRHVNERSGAKSGGDEGT